MKPCSIAPARTTDATLARIRERFRGLDKVLVAYSGGVDSTLLAYVARMILGPQRVLAVTADSPSIARADLAEAVQVADLLGVPHEVIATSEVSRQAYRANTAARCYWCKSELFERLDELAQMRQFDAVLYGAIGDDRLQERPGQRAALEHRVRAPLQEAGLSKAEIRDLARRLGVPNWDRPQNACLASRIPHGSEVTEAKLGQVEQAEAFLRSHGFVQVRVRHLGLRARIEVEPEGVARFTDVELRRQVGRALRGLGFDMIEVDRGGYRPGGANDVPGAPPLVL